MENIALFC